METEAWERTYSYFNTLLKQGHAYLIHYENSQGTRTRRTIYIRSIYHARNGYTYVKAYCSLREEVRTFREDRIDVISEVEETEEVEAVKAAYGQSYPEGGREEAAAEIGKSTDAVQGSAAALDIPYRQTSADSPYIVSAQPAVLYKKKRRGGKVLGRIAIAAMALFLFSRSPAFDEIVESLRNASRREAGSTAFINYNKDTKSTVNTHKKNDTSAKTTYTYVKPLTLEDIAALFNKIDDDKEFTAFMDSYFKQLVKQNKYLKNFKLLEMPSLSQTAAISTTKKSGTADINRIFNKKVGSFKYRGITVKITEDYGVKTYIVPAYSLLAVYKAGIKEQINSALFDRVTGIFDPYLDSIYAGADKNNDFRLSWQEIQLFQNNLYYSYKYRNNSKALRPDEFVNRGGGDCEDWALMTSGLLTYWGYRSYIGIFEPRSRRTAHAICFLYTTKKPPGSYTYIHLTSITGYKENNKDVRPGYYIPIDYNVVGGYSNAMGRNWFLVNIDNPKDIYDAPL